ncbi:MAG TPA: ATP-dependent zinc metalloprotease FtsH [Candidatus Limnocylindrales bacterium]|nr:ATP-dependent zinc metalloprotease FtsH [Candidatus Limnocylindrales bacterium]
MNTRFLRNGIVTLVLVVGTATLLYVFLFQGEQTQPIPYAGPGSFLELVKQGKVEKVVQQGARLEITTRDVDPKSKQPLIKVSQVPSQFATDIGPDIAAACQAPDAVPDCATKVSFVGADEPQTGQWLGVILTTLLPVLLIGGFIFFMLRQAQGTNNQAMSFGKSRARMFLGNKTVVTFADVAGVDEAKTELQEVVEFLKYPEKFNSLGARIPRGVLLVGPPGTGKTLLARAVAGEAGVPFFSISGSEFVEMFVGVGASRVRDLFDQAKRNSPCIVFVDEIDAVGRQRGAGLGGSHDEREQTLNQILVEMDGFDTNTNVIVVAATNRPDVLDPALLRPGRFDRQVILDRPDMKGRLEILKVHVKGKPLDRSIDLQTVSRQSPGFSGADLANLVNEAAILAARRNKKVIGLAEFSEALERVVAGPERKSRIISDAEKQIIAFHEGGHAVVQRILPKCDPVSKVSIISRGMALGYTIGLPTEDRYLQSKSEFEDKIAGMLGGNAAEKLIFGDTTTGSSNDIEKATNLARRMVTEFGMSEKLGPLAFGKRDELVFLGREIGEQRNYSDEVARQIDEEVRAIIDRCYARAMDVLTRYKDRLQQLADRLVAEETIEQDEFERMFADLPDPRKERSSTPTPLEDHRPTPSEPQADAKTAPRPDISPQPA